jgi:hypothetical protein
MRHLAVTHVNLVIQAALNEGPLAQSYIQQCCTLLNEPCSISHVSSAGEHVNCCVKTCATYLSVWFVTGPYVMMNAAGNTRRIARRKLGEHTSYSTVSFSSVSRLQHRLLNKLVDGDWIAFACLLPFQVQAACPTSKMG